MKRRCLIKRVLSLALAMMLVLTLIPGNRVGVVWADEVISAGGMSAHPTNGYNSGAFYFSMNANDSIPYNSDWSVRYTPVNAGTIQRIRDGVTTDVTNTGAETLVKYSQTEWYIESWATSGGLAQDGDILVIGGQFSGNGVKFTVDTTYIQYMDGGLTFSNKMPGAEEEPEKISLGVMGAHEKGYAEGGAFFTMAVNEKVPFNNDWSVRYIPVNANTIQRIRDGVTTDVTNTGAETLVKYSETEWHMQAWATGGEAQDGDIFVVEGEFAGQGVTFTIEKTYILYTNGTLRFSTVSPVAHQLGNMQADLEHLAPNADGGFYFTLAENEDIPYADDWSVRYYPMSAGTIQRIRDGVTVDVTNTGAQTLTKYGKTNWFVEGWATKASPDDEKGGLTVDGDIFVVEGKFNSAIDGSGITFEIAKSYIYYKDDELVFSTTMPEIPEEPVVIPAGGLSEHPSGYSSGAFYFSMPANADIPYNSDWSVRYTPVNSGSIQLIRDGVTTDVTNTAAETLVKYGETDWFVEAWAIGGGLTQKGDILVIEGDFIGQGITFTIDKTYVMYYDGELTFSSTMPEIPAEPVVVNAGKMSAHANGYDGGGFYFTMDANAVIPYNTDWSVRYMPANAGTIQLIRDGVTTDVTNTAAETLVKYGETDWHIEGWAIGGGLTKDGDVLVVEGDFVGQGITLTIEKTYILYYGGAVTFSSTMPEIPKEPVIINAGKMASHSKGYLNGGFYFTMKANEEIPYSADWSIRYMPVNAGTIQLIRDGVTTDVTNTAAETLVKYGKTDWHIEGWAIGGGLTKDGDVLVVEGDFVGQGITLTIEKTYILYYGGAVTFSSTMPEIPKEPVIINAGKMASHSKGYLNGGFYFTMKANEEIPYSADWSIRYMPVNAGTIQLIRDGVTTDVTNTAAETLVKYGKTDWHIEGWAIGGGLTKDGDVLVVEGDFVGQGITLTIEKTYILYYGGAVTFSSTMPEIPKEPVTINAGKMASHSKGYLNGGFYFTMKANEEIPYSADWSIRYMPVNAGTIQLIRDGVTTDVTNTAAETLVKYGKTDWYIEGWAIGGGLTEDGDILVVEGDFVGQGITLTIKKTYIMYYNGLVTFSSTMPEVPKAPKTIKAGKMSSHAKGYDEGGFYFTMKAHSKIPYNSDWTVRYTPVNEGTIRLIRKGKIKDVTNTAAETLVKYGETDWHMESWAIGGGLTKNGDILVVEGDFVGQGVTFTVEKTYIMYYDGLLTFSSKKPKVPSKSPVIAAGEMTAHTTKGYEKGGFYFSMKANSQIPYNSDWSVRYKPLEKGTILRIRDGVTTDVTNTAGETLVKYGAEEWFLEAWATDGGLVEEGDILVIEGRFSGNDVVFDIDKTYVRYSMGLLFFADDLSKVNKEIKPIDAGSMTAHSVNGYNAGSFYFTLPENKEIPFNTDWSVRYKPLNPRTILRVRDGETTDVTNTEAETLVKYEKDGWHLEGWATAGGLEKDGDVIIVEGQFAGNGVVLNIEKSYVLYSGGRISFYTEDEWNAREEEVDENVEEEKEETEDVSKPAPKYYTKTVLKPWVIPVFASVAGCIVAAGVIIILVLKKRKINKK